MNKLIMFFLLFSGAISVFADEPPTASSLTFIPSIALLEKRIDFDQDQSGGAGAAVSGNFSADVPMLDLSLTTAFNKWFLTLKYDFSLTDATTKTDETGSLTGSGSNQFFWQPPGTGMQLGREDKNITIGYNIIPKMNLFVGYMEGETTITPPPTCENPVISTPSPPVTQIYCQSYNYAWLRLRQHNTFTPTLPLATYVQTYTEKGPFIGMSYVFNISDAGALSFSAAYADMDGKFEDNIDVFGLQGFDAEGDVTGTSFALTWTQPLGESSSYFIDLRQQAYKMDAVDDTTSREFKTKEVMSSLALGMQFYF